MRDWLFLTRPRRATMANVVLAVSAETGIPAEAIKGRRRDNDVKRARHLAMLVMRQCCPDISLVRIAKAVNREDFSTALNGCQKAAARLQASPEERATYEAVLRRLNMQQEAA